MIKSNWFFKYISDFEIILREGLKAEGCKHIYQFTIDEKISKPLFDEYFKLMKTRKKPKKKAVKKKKKWNLFSIYNFILLELYENLINIF